MWARLLLVAALLLGVGAMHTLGHSHEETHGTIGHGAAVAAADHAPSSGGSALPETDPTSVCMAVGAFALALLGFAVAAFAREEPRWSAFLRAPVDRLLPMWRLARPPAPPSLAQLQILRI